MDRFYIITNTKKDPEYKFTNMIRDFLELNGRKCIEILPEEYKDRKRLSIAMDPKTDCLLVIGGDGSVLRAAHLVFGTGVPILGINLGTLGYLAEIDKSNWQEMIRLLLQGSYEIEPRMMLEGRMIERNGVTVKDSRILHGLNEAVIVRNSAFRVLNFQRLRGRPSSQQSGRRRDHHLYGYRFHGLQYVGRRTSGGAQSEAPAPDTDLRAHAQHKERRTLGRGLCRDRDNQEYQERSHNGGSGIRWRKQFFPRIRGPHRDQAVGGSDQPCEAQYKKLFEYAA